MTQTQSSPARLPAGAAAPQAPTSWPVLVFAAALFVLPLIILAQYIAYYRTDVVDDQMFGYYGWRIANGATVYLDVWDNKPPGIYWINALGMLVGSESYLGVIGMCVLAMLVAHGCFFGICAALYYRGAAAFSTVLLAFYLMHGHYTGGTNRTETFLVACELAAVLFYVRGFARDRWWKWFAAGACCGGAFLFKQVGLAAWGAMGLHLLVLLAMRDLPLVQVLRRGLLLVAGLAAVLGAAAAYLAWQGALDEALFATFGFNRAYFATRTSRFPYRYLTYFLLRNEFFPVLQLPLLMSVAALVHAVLWSVRPRFRPPEIAEPLAALRPPCPRYMLLFAVWAVVSLWGALLSPHAFRHYLVPAIPPLMLMAGYLVNVLQAEMRLLRAMQRRAWVTAGFVVIGYFMFDAVAQQWVEFSRVWVPRVLQGEQAEWETIADVVRQVSQPDDKIHCWGYLPGVYLHARRINAVRFTTTEKMGQVQGEAAFIGREMEERLKAEPPPVLVMSAMDYEGVHGRLEDPPRETEFGQWLDAHYERIADIQKVNVYVLKRIDRITPADRALQRQSGLQR